MENLITFMFITMKENIRIIVNSLGIPNKKNKIIKKLIIEDKAFFFDVPPPALNFKFFSINNSTQSADLLK